MLVAALIGIVFLSHLYGHVHRQFGAPGPGEDFDVMVKGVRVIGSRRLIRFSETHDPMAIESNDRLRQMLKEEGLENEWCSYSVDAQLRSGTVQRRTVVIRLGEHAWNFEPTKDALSILAGKPVSYPKLDISACRVVDIPVELMDLEPQEVLKRLEE
jgi:hypothetical protein